MSTGRVIASKYCLLYEIGRGGMGAVWVAEHLTLRSKVAVKLIDSSLASKPEAVQRFEREARAAAKLRSPHVVQVLDFGVDAGSPYIAMELLEGESLRARLDRGRLSLRETSVVMDQLGRAVSRAHTEGFVHRDLKPDNVFLVEQEDGFFVKVLDFGITKALHPTPTLSGGAQTVSGALLGTPHHMSPEQAEGRLIDARSDLWSMGVIAFECVTGRLPFEGDSLPAILRSICYDPVVVPSSVAPVPPGFDAWFACALARDPEQRFQSARALVDALEPLLVAGAAYEDDGALDEPTRRNLVSEPLRFDTVPGAPPERRVDVRVPSSIPAGIDRQRDLRHTALIHNASRTGALLATRKRCEPNQAILITLHLAGPDQGEDVAARVVRIEPLTGSMWRYEIGVQFVKPLSDATLSAIEERAARSS